MNDTLQPPPEWSETLQTEISRITSSGGPDHYDQVPALGHIMLKELLAIPAEAHARSLGKEAVRIFQLSRLGPYDDQGAAVLESYFLDGGGHFYGVDRRKIVWSEILDDRTDVLEECFSSRITTDMSPPDTRDYSQLLVLMRALPRGDNPA